MHGFVHVYKALYYWGASRLAEQHSHHERARVTQLKFACLTVRSTAVVSGDSRLIAGTFRSRNTLHCGEKVLVLDGIRESRILAS